MSKTFTQLADELHNEMAALKQKYPLIHLTESERKLYQITMMFDNFSGSLTDWANMIALSMKQFTTSVQGVFIEMGKLDYGFPLDDRYFVWLDFWPFNVTLWRIWEWLVYKVPEKWLKNE